VLGDDGDTGDAHVSHSWDGDGGDTVCLVGRASTSFLEQAVRVAVPREVSRLRWRFERAFWRNAVGAGKVVVEDDGVERWRRFSPMAYIHSSSEGLKA